MKRTKTQSIDKITLNSMTNQMMTIIKTQRREEEAKVNNRERNKSQKKMNHLWQSMMSLTKTHSKRRSQMPKTMDTSVASSALCLVVEITHRNGAILFRKRIRNISRNKGEGASIKIEFYIIIIYNNYMFELYLL